MNLRLFFAILFGKLLLFLTKSLKLGGGSAAPGLYALKIEPKLIEKLANQIPHNVVITGTNGKTTTARMLAHFAKKAGLKIIRNHTGSNLERGIASTLIQGVKLTHIQGVLSGHIGIWEADEAAFNNIVKKIKPDIVVFLNVFRDQLDRYGEVDSVVKKWEQSLKNLDSDTLLLVNGDDANTAKLTKSFKGKNYSFGVKDRKIYGEARKRSNRNNLEARNIKFSALEGSSFQLTINNEELMIKLPLPGVYHIYDFLAAFAAGYHLNLSIDFMIKSLRDYSPAFGRFEKIEITNRDWRFKFKPGLEVQILYILLIKNPVGANQVFETIAPELNKDDKLLIALNDNYADGRDVSWIWDAEYEKLKVKNSKLKVICSGRRAEDLAVRLKYAGINHREIFIENNLKRAFMEAKKDLKGRLYILPTYTALLEFQKILAKSDHKRHYWEEEVI